MAFTKKPVAIAIGGQAPAEQVNCADCRHYRLLVGRKVMRPEEVTDATEAVPLCFEEDSHLSIPAREVRADEDGCGPNGDWFEPRLVLVQ